MGDVAFYEGKRSVEVRLVDDLPLSGPYEAEFLVTERPRSTEARYSPPPGQTVLDQARAELIRSGAATFTRLALLIGFVLIVSATLLIAVRPKVRSAPPRAIAAATKPATAQPPSAPVTLDLGPREAPQSISATFQTGTGRDGSMWRKVTGLHWRLIQPGWTEQQVRRLLGGPIKVRPTKAQTGEVVSVWHYCTGLISGRTKGTVTFKDGKVVGFTAPPLDYARWVAHTPNPEA